MKVVRVALVAGLIAAVGLGVTAGGVAAYGHADGPLAQIEFSGNCNNPDFPMCYSREQGGFGLGGIWLWIEIDGGAGAISGDADVAGSACSHDLAGSGGAFSIREDVEWWWSPAPQGADLLFLLGYPPDPSGYYNVALAPGDVWSFPVSQGHYAGHPAPAVAFELQIAPSGPQ